MTTQNVQISLQQQTDSWLPVNYSLYGTVWIPLLNSEK